KTEITVGSGDTLRISISGGSVEYSKNGAVFFASAASATSFVVKASLYDLGATITNVVIGAPANGASSTAAPPGSAITSNAAAKSGMRAPDPTSVIGTAKRRVG